MRHDNCAAGGCGRSSSLYHQGQGQFWRQDGHYNQNITFRSASGFCELLESVHQGNSSSSGLRDIMQSVHGVAPCGPDYVHVSPHNVLPVQLTPHNFYGIHQQQQQCDPFSHQLCDPFDHDNRQRASSSSKRCCHTLCDDFPANQSPGYCNDTHDLICGCSSNTLHTGRHSKADDAGVGGGGGDGGEVEVDRVRSSICECSGGARPPGSFECQRNAAAVGCMSHWPSTPTLWGQGEAATSSSVHTVSMADSMFAAAKSESTKNQIVLYGWFLMKPLRDDHEACSSDVAIGGYRGFRMDDTEFIRTTPVVQRLERWKLRTTDGFEVGLMGTINIEKSVANGFSPLLVQCFMIGFPSGWKYMLLNLSRGVPKGFCPSLPFSCLSPTTHLSGPPADVFKSGMSNFSDICRLPASSSVQQSTFFTGGLDAETRMATLQKSSNNVASSTAMNNGISSDANSVPGPGAGEGGEGKRGGSEGREGKEGKEGREGREGECAGTDDVDVDNLRSPTVEADVLIRDPKREVDADNKQGDAASTGGREAEGEVEGRTGGQGRRRGGREGECGGTSDVYVRNLRGQTVKAGALVWSEMDEDNKRDGATSAEDGDAREGPERCNRMPQEDGPSSGECVLETPAAVKCEDAPREVTHIFGGDSGEVDASTEDLDMRDEGALPEIVADGLEQGDQAKIDEPCTPVMQNRKALWREVDPSSVEVGQSSSVQLEPCQLVEHSETSKRPSSSSDNAKIAVDGEGRLGRPTFEALIEETRSGVEAGSPIATGFGLEAVVDPVLGMHPAHGGDTLADAPFDATTGGELVELMQEDISSMKREEDPSSEGTKRRKGTAVVASRTGKKRFKIRRNYYHSKRRSAPLKRRPDAGDSSSTAEPASASVPATAPAPGVTAASSAASQILPMEENDTDEAQGVGQVAAAQKNGSEESHGLPRSLRRNGAKYRKSGEGPQEEGEVSPKRSRPKKSTGSSRGRCPSASLSRSEGSREEVGLLHNKGRRRRSTSTSKCQPKSPTKSSIIPPPLPSPRVSDKSEVTEAFGLKKSMHGRVLVPPLETWRSQTIKYDMDGGIIAITDGFNRSKDEASTGCYNFQVPSDKGSQQMQRKLRKAAGKVHRK